MKARAIALLLVPAALASQQRETPPVEVVLEIRSVDPTRVVNVAVDFEGELFRSLGVIRPAMGTVRCGSKGCVATTPARLTLTSLSGTGRITVPRLSPEVEVTVMLAGDPEPSGFARGRSVWFSRDLRGELRIAAPQMRWRSSRLSAN